MPYYQVEATLNGTIQVWCYRTTGGINTPLTRSDATRLLAELREVHPDMTHWRIAPATKHAVESAL